MRKSRFTEGQVVAALKEHEAGASTGELCRRLGVSHETLYRWRRKYGGLEVNEARRLRTLEEENRRLKRLLRCKGYTIPPAGYIRIMPSHWRALHCWRTWRTPAGFWTLGATTRMRMRPRTRQPLAVSAVYVLLKPVCGDDVPVPITAFLDDTALGRVVHVHQAEALAVPLGPFEVV